MFSQSSGIFSSPAYARFKHYLNSQGFTVFPVEFECLGSDHPFVDVAAKMGDMYWAFEYKSYNDSISRGVEQLRCYSEWFDYVVLVSEKQLDHRNSENYWHLKELGAGLWNFDPITNKKIERSNPSLQIPKKSNRINVARRFRNLSKKTNDLSLDISLGMQFQIPDYI